VDGVLKVKVWALPGGILQLGTGGNSLKNFLEFHAFGPGKRGPDWVPMGVINGE